ncbi:ImmA/IrrE family metallo-endopeptidase [Herbaspirillum frisingense]|uniref:ImmA/IrrE family metallo-endopeptidase n=1 Tax=Herbaspirillum frisingense TaxID=92645 RepID=UPI0005873419|nr:ImmA/IrrE family metallo-endopeptidase [Herbaspirillum frisingense]
MSLDTSTPQRAAIQLYKIIDAYSAATGTSPFPIDVKQLALNIAEQFKWPDPIVEVMPANIQKFEGALFSNDRGDKWMLAYNDKLASPGRIRFTMAHELGHYVLHRLKRAKFECGQKDVLNGLADEKNIEAQADQFASYLLMPLDDYRKQITTMVDFDLLGKCAARYDVSLTAAALKWINFTEEKAVLISHNDGFINWAWSSLSAREAGAFFKTSQSPIEIPSGSVAAEESLKHERLGVQIPLSTWWPNAEEESQIREMKISADQYGNILTLLVLPRLAKAWPKWRPR